MEDINQILPDIRLRFNIEHPTFEECYMHGYECGTQETKESANPFSPGSKESELWSEGWWAGFYGELPLFISETNELAKTAAANDMEYKEKTIKESFFTRFLEVTGAIAVSSYICYQVIDLVA